MKRNCPVCGYKDSKTLHHVQFNVQENFLLGNEHFIQQCSLCSMIFSDSNRTQKDYSSYYGELSKYIKSSNYSDLHSNRFNNSFSFIQEYLAKDTNFCDVGCGGGGFLKYLHTKEFQKLTGIDSSNLKKNGYFTFHRTDLMDLKQVNLNEFNFISCIGVLEHLFDLKEFMKNFSTGINTGTYLYIEVPSAEHYHENVTSPFQDFNLEHINHFSILTLMNFLRLNFFKPLKHTIHYQKESANYKMPVIGVVAKKITSSENIQIEFDHAFSTNIEKYIKKSEQILIKINDHLKDKLYDKSEIYIWGAGQLALKISKLPALLEKEILAYIDNNSSFKNKN